MPAAITKLYSTSVLAIDVLPGKIKSVIHSIEKLYDAIGVRLVIRPEFRAAKLDIFPVIGNSAVLYII